MSDKLHLKYAYDSVLEQAFTHYKEYELFLHLTYEFSLTIRQQQAMRDLKCSTD